MAPCTDIFITVTGILAIGVGITLIFIDANRKFPRFTEEDKNDRPEGYILSQIGAVFLAFIIAITSLRKFWRYKSINVSKGKSYPEERNWVLQGIATFYVLLFMVCIQWPISLLLQIIWNNTFGRCVSLSTKLRTSGNLFRAQLACVWLNPFWQVTKIGNKAVPKGTIIMCNHLTFADAFICSSLLWPLEPKYVGTGWLRKVPFGGQCMILAGDIFIDFKKDGDGKTKIDPEATKKNMAKALNYIKHGMNVFVFPEGTLSPTGELKEFKGSAFFRLAVENSIPIVPMAMWGNQTCWNGRSYRVQPGAAEGILGDAIEVAKDETVDTLKEKVRVQILELREQLPLYKKTKEKLALSSGNPLANNEV